MFYEFSIIFLILFPSTYSFSTPCLNRSFADHSLFEIHSSNFYSGISQLVNPNRSWILSPSKLQYPSHYRFSLRAVEISNNSHQWSNELIFKSGENYFFVNDIHHRSWIFPSELPLQIIFQTRSSNRELNSLNIQRFQLEWILMKEEERNSLPCPWECNCIDDTNCSLCSLVNPRENLLCRKDEIWCLPMISEHSSFNENRIDSKGFCSPRDQNPQCLYSSHEFNCDKLITYYDTRHHLLVHRSMFNNDKTLCFVLDAKEQKRITLTVREVSNVNMYIHDGKFSSKPIQFHRNRQEEIYMVNSRVAIVKISNEIPESASADVALNMSWSINSCPENHNSCGEPWGNQCYTNKQRCDGIWDCYNGNDEIGCSSMCPTTFTCDNSSSNTSNRPHCYSAAERCNGNSFCANHQDEKYCSHQLCNSNNGTFLCRNLKCIFEVWRCDGTDDCGDSSDEHHCPKRVSRSVVTAAVIGLTTCSILLLFSLTFSCKLLQLRTAAYRASIRLLNPQTYLNSRSDQPRNIAPPSYNQTVGLTNEHEEQYNILMDNLRLAGFGDVVAVVPMESGRSRVSNHAHSTATEHSDLELVEPTIAPSFSFSSRSFMRQFDRLRALFFRRHPRQWNDEDDDDDDRNDDQLIIPVHEPPPAYSSEQQSATDTDHNNRSASMHIRSKHHLIDKDDDDDDETEPSDDEKLIIP